MKEPFNTQAHGKTSPAEDALNDWGIAFEKKPDGTLFVPGDLHIGQKNLTALPDLTAVHVGGSFLCHDNALTSLAGAPRIIGASFNCSNNAITSLEGAPEVIKGSFVCYMNELASLQGGPRTVVGAFNCAYNQLSSLDGGPETVGTVYDCTKTSITCLEGAAQIFTVLRTPFGDYDSWQDVPEDLQMSPETRQRLKEEKECALESMARDVSTLRKDVTKPPPVVFKKR